MGTDGYWTNRQGLSRRRLFRSAAFAGAALAGAALVGCGDDESGNGVTTTPTAAANGDTTPEPVSEDEPRPGGRLGISSSNNSPNFNPVTNWLEGNYLSGIHVYDRLLEPRLDDRVYVLSAAESVETPDDVTVVFKLRDGEVYQDRDPVNGRPVEADDIVEFQYYCRDEDGAENNAFQNNSMESVEAVDEQTVVFHLQRPNAYLYSGTQLGQPANQVIVPRELMDDLEAMEPVGSGPYQLGEYQLDTRYLYERSPSWREADEGKPYIDERQVLLIGDATAQETAFRGEEIHVWINAPIESAERLGEDLGDAIYMEEYASLAPFTWMANSGREPWQDERAREALYRLFDPGPFIDLVDNGYAQPATSVLSGGLEAYVLDESEAAEYLRYDPQEARQLLEAAGFDFDQTYELTTLGTTARNVTAVQVWERQLNDVGITVVPEQLPFSEWLGPRVGGGNYDFNLNQHPGYDTPQTPLRFHHTDTQHLFRHSNLADPDVDALIEESEVALDREENIELVKQIQRELLRHYAPLMQISSNILMQPRWAYVRDWEFTAATHPYYRTEAWMDV